VQGPGDFTGDVGHLIARFMKCRRRNCGRS
jgi:hypothetical protein